MLARPVQLFSSNEGFPAPGCPVCPSALIIPGLQHAKHVSSLPPPHPFHPAHALSRQRKVYNDRAVWLHALEAAPCHIRPTLDALVGRKDLLFKVNLSQGSQRLSTQDGQLSVMIEEVA